LKLAQPGAIVAALFLVHMDILTIAARTFNGSSEEIKHRISPPPCFIHPLDKKISAHFALQHPNSTVRIAVSNFHTVR
jgi:hypothetical protein